MISDPLAVWALALAGKMRNRSPRRPRSNHAVLRNTMELVWEFIPPVTNEEPGQEVQDPEVRDEDWFWQRMRVNIALEIETEYTKDAKNDPQNWNQNCKKQQPKFTLKKEPSKKAAGSCPGTILVLPGHRWEAVSPKGGGGGLQFQPGPWLFVI